jgi:hypothetical protein
MDWPLIFLILTLITAFACSFIFGFGIGSRLDDKTWTQRPRSAWNNPTFFLDLLRWTSVQLPPDPNLQRWLFAFRLTGWLTLIFFLCVAASAIFL